LALGICQFLGSLLFRVARNILRIEGQVLELACNQERHGDEVIGGAVATRLGLGRLQQRVDRLHIAGVQVGCVKRLEDAGPVLLDGLGQILEGRQAAALGPVQPPLERLRALRSASERAL
jgi:hypothetical protein